MKKQNKQPLISIIMPVYNARKFVADSIKSMLTQTEKDFEFFIIDDCSTDGSWEIIKSFAKKDPRIKAFRNTTNLGLVQSLNKLIPKTHGHYIARMDADDISLPDRLEKQAKLLSEHPELVACGGQEYVMNEHGIKIAEKYFPVDSKTCYNMIANVMVIQPPLLMARGNIMRKLRYDNHLFKNDDISIHFKLLQYGNFGNVSDIIFQYRRVPNSLTHKDPKKVYFLALLVRLNAIYKYGYRPTPWNAVLALFETLLIAILPNTMILRLFEFMRFTYASARNAWQNGLSSPMGVVAKGLNFLL